MLRDGDDLCFFGGYDNVEVGKIRKGLLLYIASMRRGGLPKVVESLGPYP